MHAFVGAIPRRCLRHEDMLERVDGVRVEEHGLIRRVVDVGLECRSWANPLLHLEAEAVLSCKLGDRTELLGAEVAVANPMSELLKPVARETSQV